MGGYIHKMMLNETLRNSDPPIFFIVFIHTRCLSKQDFQSLFFMDIPALQYCPIAMLCVTCPGILPFLSQNKVYMTKVVLLKYTCLMMKVIFYENSGITNMSVAIALLKPEGKGGKKREVKWGRINQGVS